MRLPFITVAALAAAALILATPAGARTQRETNRLIHQQQVRYYHADGYIKAIGHVAYRTIYSSNPRVRHRWRRATHWLIHVRAEAKHRIEVLRAPPVAACGASATACAWYADGATQCEVSHEGGFSSVNPAGYYGRFQMDYGFQTSTAYGKSAYRRYGTADKWPEGVQIEHAHDVWTVRGWSPWPPYYKYGCAAYHGRSYP